MCCEVDSVFFIAYAISVSEHFFTDRTVQVKKIAARTSLSFFPNDIDHRELLDVRQYDEVEFSM